MKVYTKKGDKGTTSLVGGQRVPKNHPRLEAYGTVDELMSFTAYLRDNLDDTPRLSPYQSTLPAIAKFTLPGGHPAVSLCHICRTICRRTERIVLTLSEQYTVNEYIRQYINRLSDYFYVLGRRLTEDFNVKEILWVYDK